MWFFLGSATKTCPSTVFAHPSSPEGVEQRTSGWGQANDDIEATRRWRVNSQLLEAAHNGSLSKPMKRQGKQVTFPVSSLLRSSSSFLLSTCSQQSHDSTRALAPQGTSTRHNLFASDDGDLRKWMEKHLKPPPAAALEEGLTREEVNAHEAAGHAIVRLLLSFLPSLLLSFFASFSLSFFLFARVSSVTC